MREKIKSVFLTCTIGLIHAHERRAYGRKRKVGKEKELRLSDAYIVKDNEPSLELKVKVINIRPEEHHEILEKCQVLKEYSQFMEIVQNYQISGVEEPYKKAIKECIEKGILADYLMRKISKWRTGWT